MRGDSWPQAIRGRTAFEGALVRLIYTDEAGTSAKEPVCVVASIVVHGDNQWYPLQSEIKRIIAERVPISLQENFHFHTTEIFSGGKRINRDEWSFDDRLDFIKEILCLPLVHDVPIAVGIEFKRDWGELIEKFRQKPKFRFLDSNKFSHLMAFNACMERSDFFLRKYLGGKEIGAVVAEDVPEMKELITAAGLFPKESPEPITVPAELLRWERWQEILGEAPEPHILKIEHIVDVPHFVKKGKAPLLQLADACAFAFRRCLSKKSHGDDLVCAMLGPHHGPTFVNEPTWFSVCGSGLFNTDAYWSEEQRQKAIRTRSKLLQKAARGEI